MAEATNQTWPYVVVEDFAVRAEKIRSLANAVYVSTYHLVQPEQRYEWQNFTAKTGNKWINESISVIENYKDVDYWQIIWNYTSWDVIWDYDEYDKENPGEEGVTYEGPWLPFWQIQPTIPTEPLYNWDLMSAVNTEVMNTSAAKATLQSHKVGISQAYLISDPDDVDRIKEDIAVEQFLEGFLPPGTNVMQPISDIYYPIFEDAHKDIKVMDGKGENYTTNSRKIVGLFALSVYWKDTIRNILPNGSNGLRVVFTNPCSPTFTYQINGPEVVFLGTGDFHEKQYDDMEVSSLMTELGLFAIEDSFYSGLPINEDFCPFTIHVYPSDEMKTSYTTKTPLLFCLVISLVFVATVLTFVLYDFWVERRQRVVMRSAVKTSAIVSSLFPEVVRDQLMSSQENQALDETQPKGRLTSFLNEGKKHDNAFEFSQKCNASPHGIVEDTSTKPIAELFPETTVFFADIAGFTAWSSVREPSNVFSLLETLYSAFDKIARYHGVFKVETIGDSYVAVCGLPEPRDNHAVAMARFASKCLQRMKVLTRELELSLGPGTADLSLRVGMHSGPTIAGVLRGERARFQLFGDTVNTASRMESTSLPGKIQVSQKTAELIIENGKGSWLTAREDPVNAKGKGMLQTYWLDPSRGKSGSVISSTADVETESSFGRDDPRSLHNISTSLTKESKEEMIERLIDWNVVLFEDLLKDIVHQCSSQSMTRKACQQDERITETLQLDGISIRDEAMKTISMPNFESFQYKSHVDKDSVRLESIVLDQLRSYITAIAHLYSTEHAFHGFEHASHVLMSTVKLLQRVATRDVKKKDIINQKWYYDYTYGLGSDPLTKFGVAFSALIHDVDHQGVSNNQLVKEADPIAIIYGKSCMEQHSFHLAWALLMEPTYCELRRCIYNNQVGYTRFRQVCVNCLIATDIFDKDLKMFREARWDDAFHEVGKDACYETSSNEEKWNRKATIVMEYIIQASDVAHTMQHWHVYRRWNARLFKEMRTAYNSGRMDKDPAASWYESELSFFDNYVIPLAEKLRECEVFGVACDEFLDFATQNRREWMEKGKTLVEEMVKEM
ncbi:adenylate/guanylate cyclase [Nitzschia inconspicua]|nr:adenylate/guanylate cyclase [Nitzschia inconspicua]